ncbi:DUF5695 domain-containing protein [Parapedobacter tibetensis]|uniref:DUF5695 domain-containing protein n=1 Tax=Parapedobacter tibetensis TaxID=2972951 RepID=UPI00214D7B89|nr:DUF5695 domain-containing protein [Parapedobacter tibetensis]
MYILNTNFLRPLSLTGLVFCITLLLQLPCLAQSPWERIAQRPSTLGLEQGIDELTIPPFKLKLVKASQTVAGLIPVADTAFDYTPDERLEMRAKDGLYHLGDINFRIKTNQSEAWKSYSTATKRSPVGPLATAGNTLAAADLGPTLPPDAPISVTRFWESVDGQLVLRFELTNKTGGEIEIGSLGIPMIFNNILQDKHLDEAHADNVFFDPYIGQDAGYLQINRLHGNGPVLLVLPHENAPFEAYNPLNDDPTPRSIVFEGFHEWMIHSKAHAEAEWKGVEQWNESTSTHLKAGESKSFALKFVMAPSIREIEGTLATQKRPVAVGIPGYVVPQDVPAKLFLRHTHKVTSITAYPADALIIEKGKQAKSGWANYTVRGKNWGRARLTVTYADGLKQTISYKVIKSEAEVVADLGHFLTTTQWYENDNDLFGRSPSVINYDYEAKKHLTQESRAWYAGLSDEAGAGSWLAAIMKQVLQPNKTEVEKLKRFVNETLWGGIQYNEGELQYGVKKSLFFYEPDSMPAGTYSDTINYRGWSAWPKKEADNPGRSYNYPHVTAAHWTMYRLARNYVGLVTETPWQTSLERAYHTAMAMVKHAPYYAQFGQMEGSIFLLVLNDLKAEGLTDMASQLEAAMRKRAEHWRTLAYPFGSEMPWDSTGQEEVYLWSRYFGIDDKALVTLNAILAYMPTLPHWGYNGSARRYWDFVYGGKLSRIERQLHHYGSALNSIPVLTHYRDNPDDFYLLRVGHAGAMGALANITEDGFGPAAFHSYPATLAIDGYAGDYGSGFYGYTVNAGTYITQHPEFGWVAFSGILTQKGAWITTKVTTASQAKIFIAPIGLWITADAGRIEEVAYNEKTGEVRITFAGADAHTSSAYLQLAATSEHAKYSLAGYEIDQRGRYEVPLTAAKQLITASAAL